MLENLEPPVKRLPCKVRELLESLEPGDAEILEAAVMDSAKWKIRTLADELNDRGLIISETPLTKHRARKCSCWKI